LILRDGEEENQQQLGRDTNSLTEENSIPFFLLEQGCFEETIYIQWNSIHYFCARAGFIAEEYDFPEFTKEINKRIIEFERYVEELKSTK
jgi:hypothetical protein